MQLTKGYKITLWILIIVVLFGLYFIYAKHSNVKIGSLATTTPNQISTSTQTMHVTEGNSGYTIEQVPITEGRGPQPVPDLGRPIIVSSGAIVSPEAKILATQKVSELEATLKKNNLDFASWINLGLYQKMGGDYDGARLSWQYAAKLSPTSHIPPSDLGNLFAYFLHDTKTAETYYRTAITNDPKQPYSYIQFAQMYIDFQLGKDKALAIINEGLSKVPNDPGLQQFKASLQ